MQHILCAHFNGPSVINGASAQFLNFRTGIVESESALLSKLRKMSEEFDLFSAQGLVTVP